MTVRARHKPSFDLRTDRAGHPASWLLVIGLIVVVACTGDDQAAFRRYEDGRFRSPFGDVCERPCVFGVVLGETARSAAAELVVGRTFVEGADRSDVPNETRFYGGERNLTLRADDRGVVDDVWISIDDGSLTWGDVLDVMGAPASVRFARWGDPGYGYATWTYDHVVLTSWLDHGERLRRDGPVEAIEITAGPVPDAFFPVAMNAIAFVHHETPHFLGFISTDRYLSHPECTIVAGPFPAGEACDTFEWPQ